jgi:hypothetical protein
MREMQALNPYGSLSDLMRLRLDLDSDIALRVVASFLIAEENGDLCDPFETQS